MKKDDLSEITRTLYAAISGPPGTCDWPAFRSLFRPGARLIRVNEQVRRNMVSGRVNVMSVDQYIDDVTPIIEPNHFMEQETSHIAETSFGTASVTSKYQSCLITPKAKQVWSGANFIHLIFDARGWRIVNILWEEQRRVTMKRRPRDQKVRWNFRLQMAEGRAMNTSEVEQLDSAAHITI